MFSTDGRSEDHTYIPADGCSMGMLNYKQIKTLSHHMTYDALALLWSNHGI